MTSVNKPVFSASFLKFVEQQSYKGSKIARVLYKAYVSVHEFSCAELYDDRLGHGYYNAKGKYIRRHRAWFIPKAWTAFFNTTEANYLTFRADGTISFLPKGKEHKVNGSGDWARDGRQNGKPSKVIRKILSKNAQRLFKDADFEAFANEYKAAFSTSGFELKLLPCTEIPNVYDMDREGKGTLGSSCMNGDTDYLDIYKNCKSLQILTLQKKCTEGYNAGEYRLYGRALVWTLEDGSVFMDRVYVSQDHFYDLFLDYAEKNKWWRKREFKTYDYKDVLVSPEGDVVDKYMTVRTDTDFDHYPYIDTFTYGGDGYLTNECGRGDYEYSNTDGTRDGDNRNRYYDALNGEYIDDEDAIYIDRGRYADEYIHRDYAVEVDNQWWWDGDDKLVEIDGEYYKKDDCCWNSYDGEWLTSDDATYSEYHDTYINSDDAVYCETDSEYYHEDDANDVIVEIDGNYYRTDDDNVVEIGSSYYLKDSSDVVFSDRYSAYLLEVDTVQCETDGDYYPADDSDIVEIDGMYYRTDDEQLIEREDGGYDLAA